MTATVWRDFQDFDEEGTRHVRWFTLQQFSGDSVVHLPEPLELPNPPCSFQTLVAHMRNHFGVQLPEGAVIVHRARIVKSADTVLADEDSDVATLTLLLREDGESYGREPLLEERPHALNRLPDAPHATIWTLRAEHVHNRRRRTEHVATAELVCSACYAALRWSHAG